MINFAVIGLGGAGENHVRTLGEIPGVRVIHVVDVDQKKARKVAKENGVSKVSADYREALNDPDVQAVIVATPPFLRKEIVIDVAKAGKDLLCEKPLAINLKDALEMKAAVEKAGIKSMVNFGARNLPVFKRIREMIASGKYGKPMWMWVKYMLPATKGIFVPPNWFWKKETGGGHIVENAGHIIDFVNLIMGPSCEVSAITETLKFTKPCEGLKIQPNIEDIAILNLRHKNGGLSTIANGCISQGVYGINLDLTTDKCVISVRKTKEVYVEEKGIVVEKFKTKTQWNPIPFGLRTFVDYLKGKTDKIATFDEGIEMLKIAMSAYDSASKKKTVKIQ